MNSVTLMMMQESKLPSLILLDQGVHAGFIDDDIRAIGLLPLRLASEEIPEKLAWLRSRNIRGIYCLSEASKFRERELAVALDLPPLPEAVLETGRNKRLLHERLVEADFRYYSISASSSLPEPPLAFPFIVKPSSGYASAGVRLVKNRAEYLKAVSKIKLMNRMLFDRYANEVSGVLCEEYLDGPEVSIDAIVVNGNVRVFGVCTREYAGEDNFQDYAYFMNVQNLERYSAELQPIITKALDVLGYVSGPVHVELRKSGRTGRWHILDLAFRVGGMGYIGELIRGVTGVEYNRLAIRAWLGDLSEPELRGIRASRNNYGLVFVPAAGKGGIVKSYLGREYLQSEKAVKYFCFPKAEGERYVVYPDGTEYLAVIIGIAETEPEVMRLYNELSKKVGVIYA